MEKRKSVITVVGGGNSAHTLIPLLHSAGHTVNLLSRSPEKWSEEINLEYQLPDTSVHSTFKGKIEKCSSDPNEVIPQSEVIILCMPVCEYRNALHNIGPAINKDKNVYVGTIYGQGGFNWMVEEIADKFELKNIITFAVGLIPWVCRTKTYGKEGITYGPKSVNVVALSDKSYFESLNELVLNDICYRWFDTGKFKLAENFISLTLSVDNQIIHTTRMFGLFLKYGGVWHKQEEIPYFYRDYDQLSADLLKDLDGDYTGIREEIKNRFPDQSFTYMLDYLELERVSYNSCNSDILGSFVTSNTLGNILTPAIQHEDGIYKVSSEYRFYTDDIYYGLCIAKWIGEKLGKNTPTIDKILEWAQEVLKIDLIENKKLVLKPTDCGQFLYGIPSAYGIDSLEKLVE
ncbi:NAD/NADP octopine/nopaline dehydrogenase family protein [Ancylomarina longa]|uniref:Opine dehydrogenase domain-containing protein n=1 Tax=Ancylomarina longa TaxID=2487017 RepID=A0A434B091_9BACT|nr:NAD/NADP octopine/nopaline dehydrogenase family protein [Ancylomarina longa]RUT80127.1 hypothetical protein DLK05_01860 [Ancylomarina longa]